MRKKRDGEKRNGEEEQQEDGQDVEVCGVGGWWGGGGGGWWSLTHTYTNRVCVRFSVDLHERNYKPVGLMSQIKLVVTFTHRNQEQGVLSAEN